MRRDSQGSEKHGIAFRLLALTRRGTAFGLGALLSVALGVVVAATPGDTAPRAVEPGASPSQAAAVTAPRSAKLPAVLARALERELGSSGKAQVMVGLTVTNEPAAGERLRPRTKPRRWQRRKAAVARLQSSLAQRHPRARVLRQLQDVPAAAMEVDAATLDALLADDRVSYIRPVLQARPLLDQSVPQVGADQPFLNGNGQAVAVLDTGVDPTHAFVAGRIMTDYEGCFSSNVNGTLTFCPNGQETQTGLGAGANCPDAVAGCFHGTHVAGIAVGAGAAFNGVAESASLIPIQVFTETTCLPWSTPCAIAYSFDIDAALEHVLNLVNSGVEIAAVNMSLGGGLYTSASACDDALPSTTTLIRDLRAAGVATVIAAGNAGSAGAMAWPGCITDAVSVAATNDFDNIAAFSDRSSWTTLAAPGEGIDSSMPGDGNFAPQSGTSMASPHVAGAIAAIKADAVARGFTPSADEILASLRLSAVPVADPASGFTLSRIQVDAATDLFDPAGPPPAVVIVDDQDSEAAVAAGSFGEFADTRAYGGSAIEGTDAGIDALRFTPDLPHAGLYRVLAWWPADAVNTARAQFTITHDLGTSTVELDQTVNGSSWQELGFYAFGSAGIPSVEVAEADPGLPYVVADAVRFESVLNPQIKTLSLPDGFRAGPYSHTLVAAHGVPPYSWSIAAGALPAGLSLDPASGELHGTPSVEESSAFTVQVSDTLNNLASRPLTLVVGPPAAGAATLRVSTDNGEFVYFNGELLGSSSDWRQASEYPVLLRPGVNVVAVRALDAGSVGGAIVELELPAAHGGVLGSDSSWKVSTVQEAGWQQNSFDDDAWADATSYGQYGVLPWTRGVVGFPIDSTAEWLWSADAYGDDEVYLRYTFIVTPIPLGVETTDLPAGEVDVPYTAALTPVGGNGPYTWSLESGSLPDGLVLDPSSGQISGDPTTAGTSSFTVGVRDAVDGFASRALSITIVPAPIGFGTLRISADNGEDTYFNGELLGSSSEWPDGSTYTVAVRPGMNVVAVKGIDAGGPGAMIAELDLPAELGGPVASGPTWKVSAVDEPGWTQAGFDDGAWVGATSYGLYGVAPWGTQVLGIAAGSTAEWIWTADASGDDVVYFRYVFFAGPQPLAITTSSLPDGRAGVAYLAQASAIGGVGSYSWSVPPGSLPDGLTLNPATGELSGTPTLAGTSSFTVQVTDAQQSTATRSLSITIAPAPTGFGTLRVGTDNGEDAYVNGVLLGSSSDWRSGSTYDFELQPGLNVVAIKGIDAGSIASMVAELDLPVGQVVSDGSWKVSTVESVGWTTAGFDDSAWANATSYGQYGVGPWGTQVPAIAAGSTAEWIWSADRDGDNVAYFRYAFWVGPIPLQIETTALPDGEVDILYAASLSAIGGTGPYSWSVPPGSLPDGLTLNPATGELSGTPTLAGASSFTVEVTDAQQSIATRSLSITIVPAPTGFGTLRVGTDNGEDAYLNGVLLGSSSDWRSGSTYDFELQPGLNVIAIKGIDAGSIASMVAELDLPVGQVVSDGSWKVSTVESAGWTTAGFDDSAWANATSYGQYGVGPWGTQVPAIAAGSTAEWIWSAERDGDNVVYFRYAFWVGPIPLQIETTALPDGEVDILYAAAVSANGGTPPYTFAVVSGALPDGVDLDPDSGALDGVPLSESVSSFTVEVTDAQQSIATRSLSITIVPAPTGFGTLRVGTDNGEDAYLNGVLLGSSSDWRSGSTYDFELQPGLNVIAIKGIDAGSIASMVAELDLPVGQVVSDGSWKVSTVESVGWTTAGFDDSAWVNATSYGQYGVGPWGTQVPAIAAGSTAEWIWSADRDGDNVVYFRYAFWVGPIPLQIETTALPDGEVDILYAASLSAIGGTGPYSWSVAPGSLPDGLTLNPATGELSGTPTLAGASSFTVEVTDAQQSPATRSLSITIVPAPTGFGTLRVGTDNGEDAYLNGVLLGSSSDWRSGSTYDFELQPGLNVIAIKGIDAGSIASMVAELDLPVGQVVSDGSWKVSTVESVGWTTAGFDDSAWANATSYGQYGVGPWGTQVPAIAAGSTAEWIWSADRDGDNVVYFRYAFWVGPIPLQIETTVLPDGEVDIVYAAAVSANGGTPPYTFAVVSGALPDGVGLDPDSGALDGVPLSESVSSFTVEVTDVQQSTVSQSVSITIAAGPAGFGTLRVGTDNGEDAYLNGVLLGSSSDWRSGSTYDFELQPGLNVIAIKGIDAGSIASMVAELDLPVGQVVSDGSWKVSTVESVGWTTAGFDDSVWANATSYGQYGVGPWGTQVPAIAAGSTAEWIWSADRDGDNVVYFRYTFTVE